MGIMTRAAELLGFAKRSDEGEAPPGFIPSRSAQAITTSAAVRISNVFRALQIIETSAKQLGVKQLRNGKPAPALADFIESPAPGRLTRSSFFSELVTCLATDGNAFVRVIRDRHGVLELRPLPPESVHIREAKTGKIEYVYQNSVLHPATRDRGDVLHMKFIRFTGVLRGLGPIEAARTELEGVRDARDYSAYWMRDSDSPSGTLTTDQAIPDETAKRMKNSWEGRDAEGNRVAEAGRNGPGIRILSNGLKYEPNRIKPADMQFLETQQFNTTQISRLFGVPASLMLATVQGGSQSYANVEQDWISFTRFTLMSYITEIEDVLSELLPPGERIKFNLEALSRSDTLTRYQGYALAIDKGFLTKDEVREFENLPPLEESANSDSWVADTLADAVAEMLKAETQEVDK